MDWRILSLNSLSKPFITEETKIKIATPKARLEKAIEETKDKKPALLLLKYFKAINKGMDFIFEN